MCLVNLSMNYTFLTKRLKYNTADRYLKFSRQNVKSLQDVSLPTKNPFLFLFKKKVKMQWKKKLHIWWSSQKYALLWTFVSNVPSALSCLRVRWKFENTSFAEVKCKVRSHTQTPEGVKFPSSVSSIPTRHSYPTSKCHNSGGVQQIRNSESLNCLYISNPYFTLDLWAPPLLCWDCEKWADRWGLTAVKRMVPADWFISGRMGGCGRRVWP